MEERDERLMRAIGHYLAARRLQDGLRKYGAMRGLQASLRHHVERIAVLSTEICGGAGRDDQALARVSG